MRDADQKETEKIIDSMTEEEAKAFLKAFMKVVKGQHDFDLTKHI